MGPRASLDVLGDGEIISECQDSNSGSSSPWPTHCTDYPAPASYFNVFDVQMTVHRDIFL